MLDRRILRVVTVWGISRHYMCMGKNGSRLTNPAMRWDFNVPIALSAKLLQCRWGSHTLEVDDIGMEVFLKFFGALVVEDLVGDFISSGGKELVYFCLYSDELCCRSILY